MLKSIILYPSMQMTRWLLAMGLILFILVYSYMLSFFSEAGITTDEFNTVWLSFDVNQFKTFIEMLDQQGNLPSFLATFKWNILSISAFMVAFYSLALIIARNLSKDSRLSKIAPIFPLFAVGIALIDILSSLLIISAGSELGQLSVLMANTISGAYVARVIPLYILLIWFIVAGFTIIREKYRNSRQ